jgi:hypothetical protein
MSRTGIPKGEAVHETDIKKIASGKTMRTATIGFVDSNHLLGNDLNVSDIGYRLDVIKSHKERENAGQDSGGS